MLRFIARGGLNKPDKPDVMFLESVAPDNYDDVRAKKLIKQNELRSECWSHNVVIYRNAIVGGRFYLSRQSDCSDGNEVHLPELEGSRAVGYALFGTLDTLTSEQAADAVAEICNQFGQQGPPTDAGPH